MVKQPPAGMKTTITTTAADDSSSKISNSVSSANKTGNLSTTQKATKKKYGGVSPNSRSRSSTKELVLPPDDSQMVAPQFAVGLKSLNIGDGERLTLQCSVTGDPEPQVKWYKDGKKIESNDFVDLTYKCGLATLKVEEVYPEDAGEYTCIAKNIVSSVESKCTLKVKRKYFSNF